MVAAAKVGRGAGSIRCAWCIDGCANRSRQTSQRYGWVRRQTTLRFAPNALQALQHEIANFGKERDKRIKAAKDKVGCSGARHGAGIGPVPLLIALAALAFCVDLQLNMHCNLLPRSLPRLLRPKRRRRRPRRRSRPSRLRCRWDRVEMCTWCPVQEGCWNLWSWHRRVADPNERAMPAALLEWHPPEGLC